MTAPNLDFRNIRQWRGSQHQAFEELCYQLRDLTPEGAELVKTGNPDSGLEWYVTFRDGKQWGWQAKFSFDVDSVLNGMEKSLRTVVKKRPECRRLTFCIPFDLPDAVDEGKRKSARKKFEDRKESWRNRIPGADQVHIELWSGGDLLQRLVRHPGQRGITRFFWNSEVFSSEWCAQRMSIIRDRARRRYRPELHVDVPVSFALEGLALSDNYWRRFRGARNAVIEAAGRIQVGRYSGLGVTKEVRHLKMKVAEWQLAMPGKTTLPERLQRDALHGLTRECMEIIEGTSPARPRQVQRNQSGSQRIEEQRVLSLSHDLRALASALGQVENLLLDDASKAAANGALLLKGSAGQGKTHLFCDAAVRAIDAGHPAAVILGGNLSGRDVWSEIGKQLGLADVGSEELVSAMQSAAEASNAPFLLLLDALNEAADPAAWRAELPKLFAEVAHNPWISVAVSVRSTFLAMVLPPDGLGDVTEVDHPGFDGRELEATERIFDFFGLEQPRIPLLTPEFTNPLFLILYCESLEGMGLTAPPLGGEHLSETFRRYLDWKEKRIAQHLRMDPELHPVQAAIGSFSSALMEANTDTLPYATASDMIEKFGNGSQQWPDTLFGQLLSEDVLTNDVAWDHEAKEPRRVVRFTYQQFADYQVVSIILEPFGHETDSLRQALSAGEPLHQTFLDAPPNWVEGLSVLVPERFGIELQDAAQWHLNGYNRHVWDSALITSVTVRRSSAVTERTRELLAAAQQRNRGLQDFVLEAWLSVAAQLGHALNAYTLHETLEAMSMPDRDAVWSISTYHALDQGGPLDRLVRWASRSRRPDCPPEVVELAAITLVWTFTSPNRTMRDQATKALAQLLSEHLPVLKTLIPRFAGVNDPYVIERLAMACHGAILCGGTKEPQSVIDAADELRGVVFADNQLPNITMRDAVRGIYEWCLHNDWIDQEAYVQILPPYLSAPPSEPPSEQQLRRDYDTAEYGSLRASVFSMGDFGRYIIEPAMHRFTRNELRSAVSVKDERTMFSAEWGQRWIFHRVISLGWTPQDFAAFDNAMNRGAGRTEHKPERFGKKYQWIAFRELMARLSDNYQMVSDYGGESGTYMGPWQLWSRDIDPTLPPPQRTRKLDGEVEIQRTFADDIAQRWMPDRPNYHDDDPPVADGWGTETNDIPEFERLVKFRDGDGNRWVVVHAWHNWVNELSPSTIQRSNRRDFWSHIYSWLVRPEQLDAVVAHIERRSLMGRWMPEGASHIDDAYLGEIPWAVSVDDAYNDWEPIRGHGNWSPAGLEVLPAWEEYLWEGNVLDCSIDDAVRAWYPATVLVRAGRLNWKPGTREWIDPLGTTVARFVDSRDHSILLVREDWLRDTLRKMGVAIVFGWLGEKRLFEKGTELSNIEIMGRWTEISSAASLQGRRWKFGERGLEERPLKKPATVTVHDQALTYDELAPFFPPERVGKWVVIAGQRPLGFFDTSEEAERVAEDQGFDLFNRYIRLVGSSPPLVISMADR